MDNFNYFADGEQSAQRAFQSRRDRLLGPLVALLLRLGVTPNMVSGLGMLALAPFAWLVIAMPEPQVVAWAWLLLLLHVVLDGIDGPLARRMGAANPAGAFVDMCCDHGGLIIVVWTLSAAGLVDGTLGNIYVSLYTLAIICIVWLNRAGQPFRYVFRSKYFLYGMLLLVSFAGMRDAPLWHWLDWALLVFSAGNLWICILGFQRIYRLLDATPD